MWGDGAAFCFIAAFCLATWASKADHESFIQGATGNGYLQCTFGRGALQLAPPACYRILFPFLIAWDKSEAKYEQPTVDWWQWLRYQVLRFAVLWLALVFLSSALGMIGMLTAATIYGLTLRYDYWSNAIELLAVGLVLAAPGLHWPWWTLLAAGLVLGTGRETLPFLALLGTPHAIALAVGAAGAQLAVRYFTDTTPEWKGSLEYARPRWRANWEEVIKPLVAPTYWNVAIYLLVGVAAAFSAPWLAVGLVATTFLMARIDEPRTLTMLVPFAAMTVLRWV